jgi:FlaA1/EpsC-like NDP-sugar epimerase
VALKLLSYWLFGLYGGIWRYSSINEAFSVFKAVTVASLATTGLVFFTQALPFPRSVILLDWFLNLLFIGGLRFTPRLRRELGKRRIVPDKRLLIIGAGDAGEMVLREINKHPELGYKIIGFIDDDLKKVGRRIHNLKVLGTRKEIAGIISQKNIDELIIAIPSASGKVTREIIREGEKTKAKLRILPGIYKVIKGDVTISEIREVKLEDLLGRKPVEMNLKEISQYLEGKSVLITGAAGSIGSELSRQIMRFKPGKLLLLDNNENDTYFLQMELLKKKYSKRRMPVSVLFFVICFS